MKLLAPTRLHHWDRGLAADGNVVADLFPVTVARVQVRDGQLDATTSVVPLQLELDVAK